MSRCVNRIDVGGHVYQVGDEVTINSKNTVVQSITVKEDGSFKISFANKSKLGGSHYVSAS